MTKESDHAPPETKLVNFRMPVELYKKWTNLYPMRTSVKDVLITLIERDVAEKTAEKGGE